MVDLLDQLSANRSRGIGENRPRRVVVEGGNDPLAVIDGQQIERLRDVFWARQTQEDLQRLLLVGAKEGLKLDNQLALAGLIRHRTPGGAS